MSCKKLINLFKHLQHPVNLTVRDRKRPRNDRWNDRGGSSYNSNQQQDDWNYNMDSRERTGNSGNDIGSAFALLNESMQQMKSFTQINHFRQIPETIFTVHCGEVRAKDEGVRVKIAGKVFKRPHTSRFLEIKDMRGFTQLVARDDQPEVQLKFQNIPNDAYISVIGTVQLRPDRFINRVK